MMVDFQYIEDRLYHEDHEGHEVVYRTSLLFFMSFMVKKSKCYEVVYCSSFLNSKPFRVIGFIHLLFCNPTAA